MQHEPAARRGRRAGRLWKWTAPILASLLAMPAMAQEGLRASNVQCVAETALDAGGYTLNCTANDIRIARATILPDANGNAPKCPYPGAPLTFKAIFEVESTATERYDVGLWFVRDGDANGDGAMSGRCSIATLPTGGSGRNSSTFINVDGAKQPDHLAPPLRRSRSVGREGRGSEHRPAGGAKNRVRSRRPVP